MFILFLIASSLKLLLRLLKNSIVARIPMIINKSLILGTCHYSLIDFYIFVSFLSPGNSLLFILYTCKSHYGVIFDWIPCTMILMLVSVDQRRLEIGNFDNRVASNFLLLAYDIYSAYRKLLSLMRSLFLANNSRKRLLSNEKLQSNIIMFFQTIINLFFAKTFTMFYYSFFT